MYQKKIKTKNLVTFAVKKAIITIELNTGTPSILNYSLLYLLSLISRACLALLQNGP